MSKKRDPLTTVIQYFTTAPVDEAARVLTIVKEIVRSRAPVLQKRAPPARRAASTPPAPAAAAMRGLEN